MSALHCICTAHAMHLQQCTCSFPLSRAAAPAGRSEPRSGRPQAGAKAATCRSTHCRHSIAQYTSNTSTVHCHCTQYTVHNTLYTIHCTQYTVHNTQYTIHCQYSPPPAPAAGNQWSTSAHPAIDWLLEAEWLVDDEDEDADIDEDEDKDKDLSSRHHDDGRSAIARLQTQTG